MKIPESLKIGGHVYKVSLVRHWKDDDDAQGQTDPEKLTIFINADLGISEQEATLIHEVLHVLNKTLNHELLDSISEQLYQVLHDNSLLKD